MSADTLATYLALVDQQANLLTHRARVTAEIVRLHREARPLHQELLKTMTPAELDAAYAARQRALLGSRAGRLDNRPPVSPTSGEQVTNLEELPV